MRLNMGLVLGLVLRAAAGALADEAGRERILMNADWRFQKDDPAGIGDALEYSRISGWVLPTSAAFVKDPTVLPQRPEGNLGESVTYTQAGFDDSGWWQLDLPHDWAIEGPFKPEYRGETGKLKYWGPVWYRHHLTLPAGDAGRRIYLDIDGAMSHSLVWCNGQFVGGWPYGYSSFRLDLTPFAQPGKDNVIAIRLNTPNSFSRWYPGGGLYRNIWLVKTGPVHVDQWGTFVTTPQVTTAAATVAMQVRVANHQHETVTAVVKTQLRFAGQPVADLPPSTVTLPTDGSAVVSAETSLAGPQLWDTVTPNRYLAVTVVEVAGKAVDRYETPFGIRSIRFTADNGFLLNGKRVPIQGVCNHHDLGALGAAFNVRAAQRQLEVLKEMGCNALRTSHNMPAPELLDLCDAMGILVMDESFDCWERTKTGRDYAKLFPVWHEQDLRAECRRDRNHPSVILWSIGNEVEVGDPVKGPALAGHLSAIVHEEDPTRPTVVGSNSDGANYNGVQTNVDVMGLNYEVGGYANFARRNPTRPLVGSETSSCISSRGEYFFQSREAFDALLAEAVANAARQNKPMPAPGVFQAVSQDKNEGKADFQMSSYDLYAPPWGWVPDAEFASQENNPRVAGEFVWTGFDYLGEPTPYNGDMSNLLNFHDSESRARAEKELKQLGKIKVPSRSSYFGIVDLAGFKKDRFYLYQAHWRPDLPMAHLLPHWTWPERQGLVTPVHVYTSGDEAELFLNGQSQGRKKKAAREYRLRWDNVVYAPGVLKVVAYKNGKEWATDTVKTAGAAAGLKLAADRQEIAPDRQDLAFVTCRVQDAAGVLVPQAKTPVTFSISGPGELVATDNGDATSLAPFQSPQVQAYNGLALAIIRATGSGTITVQAKAEGLSSGSVKINPRWF